jgi:hypothetical protein
VEGDGRKARCVKEIGRAEVRIALLLTRVDAGDAPWCWS